MGAAVTIELQKPLDGSDIKSSGQLDTAKAEVTRLRRLLGQLAKESGRQDMIYDASDLCLGVNVEEDFDRCISEICHIRKALQMNTQRSRRLTRFYTNVPSISTVDQLNIQSQCHSDIQVVPSDHVDSDSDSSSDSTA